MSNPKRTRERELGQSIRRASLLSDLPAVASAFAEAGLLVFPCVPGAKRPLTGRGFHDATTSLAQVRAWWNHMPDANIGLATGAASGVVVVDVDVHASGSGFPAFSQASAAGWTDRWSTLVRTPSGGLHAYFPQPAGSEPQRCWQSPRSHIDFRGDGGYVIAPQSRVLVDGQPRTYELIAIAQHEPRPLDADSLRRLLEPPARNSCPPSLPAIGSRPDRLAAWVAARPEGARNHGLFWAACRMAEDGHPLTASLSVLGEAAGRAGLPEREAETTIRSAHRIASRLAPGVSSRATSRSQAVAL